MITLIAVTILESCSTGRKAYQRGDYYIAALQAINRLRANPDSKKAREALEVSYPMALQHLQRRADAAMGSDNNMKYSEVAGYYELMNQLADEISRSPAALNVFPKPNFYARELQQARELAAGEHYGEGLASEQLNTRQSWKDAFFYFQQADQFVPGFKDARERMENARYHATLKVIVEQIPVPRNYQLTADFFLNQVLEYLAGSKSGDFVAFYSPEAAQNAGIDYPDQVLRMNFDNFVIGQTYDKEVVREFSRDSVVVGEVTLPDGTKQKAYNTVKARLTTYRREVLSTGLLDVTIIDYPLNQVIAQRKFNGQFIWFTEWGSFNGDERALSKEQLALCNKKPHPVPGPQSLFVEFTRPIFDQVTPFLKNFYGKY
jgi:hypothetical protein